MARQTWVGRARYALILGHNRHEVIQDVVHDILDQVDRVIIIDNASDPGLETIDYIRDNAWVVKEPEQPPNLSRLWNIGFEFIREEELLKSDYSRSMGYDIAVLTDDVRIPDGWFDHVQAAMDEYGCVAGCSNPFPQVSSIIVKRQPDSDLMGRMYGPAFILRGEAALLADDELRWWWGDTDLDFKARKAGGMVKIPGLPVINRFENQSTVGSLMEQAGRDGETFVKIWGFRPW